MNSVHIEFVIIISPIYHPRKMGNQSQLTTDRVTDRLGAGFYDHKGVDDWRKGYHGKSGQWALVYLTNSHRSRGSS